MTALGTISAVIPSKNRPGPVRQLVKQLREQHYPQDRLEIVVVDDGSEAAYDLGEYGVRLIRHEESRGAQASRNEAIDLCGGEYVFMLDDDIELMNEDYLKRAVEKLQQQALAGAVFGRKIDVIHDEAGIREHEFSLPRVTWYSGEMVPGRTRMAGRVLWGNQVYLTRRELLEELGGYDGIYGLNGGHSFREESDLHARMREAGYLLWYEPGLGIKHHVYNQGGHGGDVSRRLYWIAHNHVIFCRRHLPYWRLKALGFGYDILRYSWVQSRLRSWPAMVRGYFAGWRNAWRDRYPERNEWLES